MHPCTGTEVLYRPYGPQRGSRGIALLFLDHGPRRGWGVSVTLRPLFTPGKDPGPIVQEAVWAPGPFWTGAENLVPPPGLNPRTVQSVASRYTDWATRPTLRGAQYSKKYCVNFRAVCKLPWETMRVKIAFHLNTQLFYTELSALCEHYLKVWRHG